MKDILKKNQVIIAALAIMICVAGYLNFTQDKIENKGTTVSSKDAVTQTKNDTGISEKDATVIPDASDTSSTAKKTTVDADKVLQENETDISDESDSKTDKTAKVTDTNELSTENSSKESADSKEDVGEAVLANSSVSNEYFASAKLKREQTRAKSKEALMKVINNKNISEDQKQKAINEMIKLTGYTDKEVQAETLLEAKGFKDCVVTISENSVDVVVNCNELTEQQMAQIEDIVKRKTDISAEHIVISPAKVTETDSSKKTSSSSDTDSNSSKSTSSKSVTTNKSNTDTNNSKSDSKTE